MKINKSLNPKHPREHYERIYTIRYREKHNPKYGKVETDWSGIFPRPTSLPQALNELRFYTERDYETELIIEEI